MEIKEIKKLKKNLPRFFCKVCDFECYMKCDWDRHISRPKHLFNVGGNDLDEKKLKKTYNCDCGKIFNSTSGLWKHKKKCIEEIESENKISNEQIENKIADKELINYLIKENQEFKNLILEIVKKDTMTNCNNTNTINNNKTFNLQFFLNETCKDAMNIMDFVDSIKLQLSDLEKVGEIGYVEGISNIITTNLKALDVTQRPIHCTDKKREVVYIKDENKWEKEDENKKKLRRAIKKVASKNQRLILNFQQAHPDCGKASSRYSDQFNKIIVESMGGSGDNDIEKEDKIIRKISSVTTIDKRYES
jgi:hypothetical protein